MDLIVPVPHGNVWLMENLEQGAVWSQWTVICPMSHVSNKGVCHFHHQLLVLESLPVCITWAPKLWK